MFRSKTKPLFVICILLGSCLIGGESIGKAEALPAASSFDSLSTYRVSISSGGTQANETSLIPFISGDGRFVTFSSRASNLVSGDNNGVADGFLRDTQTETTTLISVSSAGIRGNGQSNSIAITPDGRYVAFWSAASNLVTGDTNNKADVFLRDTQTSLTTRVSVASNGTQGSGDSGTTGAISANGRFITFTSTASNLVSTDTNGVQDIFLHDTLTGVTSLISKTSSGVQGDRPSYRPSISSDGRYVVFNSEANNLAPGDNNTFFDVFLHDTFTGQTTLVSRSSQGISGTRDSLYPKITPDGKYIIFQSNANNLVVGDVNNFCPVYYGALYKSCYDIFLYEVGTQKMTLVSLSSDGTQGNKASTRPSFSSDSRYIVFLSEADNLVSGDTNGQDDIFFRDLQTGITTLASVSSTDVQGNKDSSYPDISADGRFAVFASESSNLVSGDTNNTCDVFPFDGIFTDNCPDIFLRMFMQFSDVPSSHWASDYIEAIANAGLTSGYPDGTYRPENRVTRAEMAVFLLNALGISPGPLPVEPSFSDISGHWAETFIEELFDQGITGGYPDGTYQPENRVTRAEMAVFLLNALGISPGPLPLVPSFSDISGHWAETFIEELNDQGITGGYPDGTYRPDNRVTRAEMAVFLVNTFSIPLP